MFLPVGDNVDRKALPILPGVLIFLNLLVFIIQVRIFFENPRSMAPTMQFIERWGLVPADLAHGRAIGLFTYMFLHGGLAHILGNMLALWAFACTLEFGIGAFNLAVFYVLWGLAGGGLHAAMNWGSDMPLVGASGAIAGLMGAYAVLYGPESKIKTLIFLGFRPFVVNIPAAFFCAAWFWMQVWSASHDPASEGGVAWYAHIGGFLAGALTAALMRGQLDTRLVRDKGGELTIRSRTQAIDSNSSAVIDGVRMLIAEHDIAGDGSELPEECPFCATPIDDDSRITPAVARCANPECGRFIYAGAGALGAAR